MNNLDKNLEKKLHVMFAYMALRAFDFGYIKKWTLSDIGRFYAACIGRSGISPYGKTIPLITVNIGNAIRVKERKFKHLTTTKALNCLETFESFGKTYNEITVTREPVRIDDSNFNIIFDEQLRKFGHTKDSSIEIIEKVTNEFPVDVINFILRKFNLDYRICLDETIQNSVSNLSYSNTKDSNIKPTVRVGFFKHLDGYLSFLFQFAFQRNLNAIFVPIDSWGHCIDAFNEDKIDITIHSFPTSLIPLLKGETLNFKLLYTFKGYKAFANCENFDSFRTNEKIAFLRKAKFFVEKGTEIDWILKRYVEKLGLDYLELNIIDENINTGKIKFLESSNEAIYFTNVETYELFTDEIKKILGISSIDLGHVIGNFKNMNGIIYKGNYSNSHPEVIDEFSKTWFSMINVMLKVLGEYSNIKNDVNKRYLLHMYQGLIHIHNRENAKIYEHINKIIKTKLSENISDKQDKTCEIELNLSDLFRCYSLDVCNFYKTELNANNAFKQIIGIVKILEVNKAIAKIQADDANLDIEIEKRIEEYTKPNN